MRTENTRVSRIKEEQTIGKNKLFSNTLAIKVSRDNTRLSYGGSILVQNPTRILGRLNGTAGSYEWAGASADARKKCIKRTYTVY